MPLLAFNLRKINDLGIAPELCFHALVLQPNVSGSMPQGQLDRSSEKSNSTWENTTIEPIWSNMRMLHSVGERQRAEISKENKPLHTSRTPFQWTLNWTYLSLSHYPIVSHNLLRHLGKVMPITVPCAVHPTPGVVRVLTRPTHVAGGRVDLPWWRLPVDVHKIWCRERWQENYIKLRQIRCMYIYIFIYTHYSLFFILELCNGGILGPPEFTREQSIQKKNKNLKTKKDLEFETVVLQTHSHLMRPNRASPFTAPAEVKKDKAFRKCVGYPSCVEVSEPIANIWWTKSCSLVCILPSYVQICPNLSLHFSGGAGCWWICPSTVASI